MTHFGLSELFEDFEEHMFDKGGNNVETKRARALYHIQSILKHHQLDNKTIGLSEVRIGIVSSVHVIVFFAAGHRRTAMGRW